MVPWFNWEINALSDLGHSINSDVSYIFSSGLLLGGFFLIVYSITSFRKHSKYTSYFLVFVGFALQLIGTFDEVYGFFHFLVSLLFFVLLVLSSVVYVIEKKSFLALLALVTSLISWLGYGYEIYSSGIAVPQFISSIVTSIWIIKSSLNTILS